MRSDIQQTTVMCDQCKKTVTTEGGNTANLFQHLKVEYGESQWSGEGSSAATVTSKPNIFFSTSSYHQGYHYRRNTLKYCDIVLGPYNPTLL